MLTPRLRPALGALVPGLLVIMVSGCTGAGSAVKGDSSLLPKPGALVELRDVKNASGQTFDVDVEATLRRAMHAALEQERLEWRSGARPDRLVLDLRITEYRPGNAFQRWLLPGYGSTVLAVEGTVKEAQTDALAASILHQRSVHFGGAYTIGAWKRIFDTVAGDIARDLKIRIERGGQFVVYLTPRADQAAVPQPSGQAVKIKLAGVTDARQDRGRIGTREAAFGVSMGEVHLGQNVADAVQQALSDDLLAAGYRLVETGQDLTAEGRLRKFWVRTDTTALYWDVVGEVELELAVVPATQTRESVQKAFACRQVQRTYVWPSATLLGKVLDACVAELMLKVRTDAGWK